MFKKLIGVFVLMFLMAIAVPVLAQRYDSCDRRGGRSYSRNYDNGRHHGRRGDNGRRNNRRANYGRNYGYAPAYYAPTYYAPSYYVVRRPARRYYNNGYYRRPHYRNRNRISFSIGF